ncbi:hypothetical protein [Enhygromyxa salina]|uniref:Uncharacterized protein n=1 Tax=Enhygromyxa salina TaxID=215803 RepID=A0A2S9Y5W3_9BACT|nr:hypothetical protein [Enhygromyxa salina]PRQ00497.1 hypothetical protein ENSA7_59910 [Enhygromyxa salina]
MIDELTCEGYAQRVALPLHDRVGLTTDQRAELLELLASHHMLQDVARWRMVSDIVTQDEYSLDVIVAWDHGLFLVYDTT